MPSGACGSRYLNLWMSANPLGKYSHPWLQCYNGRTHTHTHTNTHAGRNLCYSMQSQSDTMNKSECGSRSGIADRGLCPCPARKSSTVCVDFRVGRVQTALVQPLQVWRPKIDTRPQTHCFVCACVCVCAYVRAQCVCACCNL